MNTACEKSIYPCDVPEKSLGRIVHLSKLDGYIFMRKNEIYKIGSRYIWKDHKDLAREAKMNTECVSDKIFMTGI